MSSRAAYDDLARTLDRLEIVNCDKKPFIPADGFDGAVTRSFLSTVVSDLLPFSDGGASAHVHLQQLYESYRKVIAILVMMRYEQSFVRFWETNTCDRDLPLDQERLAEIDGDLWWPKWNGLQYKFLARMYCEETESQQWSDDYVLPILEKVYRSRGAFSEVYKIHIHPHYDRLNFRGHHEPHWYALKQLKTSADAKVNERKLREWQDEVAANALVRKQQHNNYAYSSILPLLHSHTYGKQCNLVFPLANYNLREFYAKEPMPPSSLHRFRFVEQISRLVPALGLIHQGEIDSTCQWQWIGLHRDLKPDNILVVCGMTPRFMISDLGLMKFRKVKSGSREYSGEEWKLGVSAYKAPECDVKGKRVGRGADIWSLGCILAEAITWCVCGLQGIREFQRRRSTEDSYGDSSDVFFCKSGSPGAKEVPRLKTEVLDWFAEVKKAAGEEDRLVAETLALVELMLKENDRGAKGRPSAEKIDCAFYTILKQEASKQAWPLSISEPAYYFKNLDRRTHALPRDILPFSYSRSTSLMTPTTPGPMPFSPNFPSFPRSGGLASPAGGAGAGKRRRSEDDSFVPPSLPNSSTGSTVRPVKRKREVSAFAHLKRLDTMFLIDDFVSETPWTRIRTTLQKLSSIATQWDQDGVDIAFINSSSYASCLSTPSDVLSALDKTGYTATSTSTLSFRLDMLLSSYINLYKRDEFTKPLNMIIITSGDFLAHDEFEKVVMTWAKQLDEIYAPKSQLSLQFVLVGCKGENRRRFEDLDDELYKEYGVRDMVDATCYDPNEPDSQEVFEKILCGGMIATYNRVQDETSDLSMMAVDL